MKTVESMPVDKRMDILVAEKVMGKVPCDKWKGHYGGWGMAITGPVFTKDEGDCNHDVCYPIGNPAHYSTNIAAAWQVVEKVITGTVWECYLTHQFDGWSCLFAAPNKLDIYGVGETAPLAICRAVLNMNDCHRYDIGKAAKIKAGGKCINCKSTCRGRETTLDTPTSWVAYGKSFVWRADVPRSLLREKRLGKCSGDG